jgi:hypothetical protein
MGLLNAQDQHCISNSRYSLKNLHSLMRSPTPCRYPSTLIGTSIATLSDTSLVYSVHPSFFSAIHLLLRVLISHIALRTYILSSPLVGWESMHSYSCLDFLLRQIRKLCHRPSWFINIGTGSSLSYDAPPGKIFSCTCTEHVLILFVFFS